MGFITYNDLTKNTLTQSSAFNILFASTAASSGKIFLSYRRKDLAYVKPIIGLLISNGASIYIDYLDEELPNPPDHTTAAKLRSRIKDCKKFILIATPNSKESTWMPWELGVGDAAAGYDNTLILPVLSTSDYWGEREYFKVYGYIRESNSSDNSKVDLAVHYPDGRNMWLSDWLKK